MGLRQKMTSWWTGDPRRRGEDDAPTDPVNGSREEGGGPDIGTMDKNSTTGTTESGTFVGRAGSDETGDVGLSGGEARTGGEVGGDTGAARDGDVSRGGPDRS